MYTSSRDDENDIVDEDISIFESSGSVFSIICKIIYSSLEGLNSLPVPVGSKSVLILLAITGLLGFLGISVSHCPTEGYVNNIWNVFHFMFGSLFALHFGDLIITLVALSLLLCRLEFRRGTFFVLWATIMSIVLTNLLFVLFVYLVVTYPVLKSILLLNDDLCMRGQFPFLITILSIECTITTQPHKRFMFIPYRIPNIVFPFFVMLNLFIYSGYIDSSLLCGIFSGMVLGFLANQNIDKRIVMHIEDSPHYEELTEIEGYISFVDHEPIAPWSPYLRWSYIIQIYGLNEVLFTELVDDIDNNEIY